jgi:hydroxymethylpyrimidine pyrophosphatase-like HAD family hydrolase
MDTLLKNITKLELKSLGLNDYLVQKIVKGLKADQANGFNVYTVSDLTFSIKEQLEKSKTKENTKQKLQRVLDYLEGKSNVVEVDFLQQLTPEKKIIFLKDQMKKLEEKEQILMQETNEVVRKATRILIAK